MGEAAAAAMIALRTDDGSAPPEFYLPASAEPGRVAADAELSAGGRRPAAVAESAPVCNRDHGSVPRRAAAGAHELALRARLQGGEASGRRR